MPSRKGFIRCRKHPGGPGRHNDELQVGHYLNHPNLGPVPQELVASLGKRGLPILENKLSSSVVMRESRANPAGESGQAQTHRGISRPVPRAQWLIFFATLRRTHSAFGIGHRWLARLALQRATSSRRVLAMRRVMSVSSGMLYDWATG